MSFLSNLLNPLKIVESSKATLGPRLTKKQLDKDKSKRLSKKQIRAEQKRFDALSPNEQLLERARTSMATMLGRTGVAGPKSLQRSPGGPSPARGGFNGDGGPSRGRRGGFMRPGPQRFQAQEDGTSVRPPGINPGQPQLGAQQQMLAQQLAKVKGAKGGSPGQPGPVQGLAGMKGGPPQMPQAPTGIRGPSRMM
jgi:hypothetical protein